MDSIVIVALINAAAFIFVAYLQFKARQSVTAVSHQINGRMEQMLALAKAEGHSEGRKEGREEMLRIVERISPGKKPPQEPTNDSAARAI